MESIIISSLSEMISKLQNRKEIFFENINTALETLKSDAGDRTKATSVFESLDRLEIFFDQPLPVRSPERNTPSISSESRMDGQNDLSLTQRVQQLEKEVASIRENREQDQQTANKALSDINVLLSDLNGIRFDITVLKEAIARRNDKNKFTLEVKSDGAMLTTKQLLDMHDITHSDSHLEFLSRLPTSDSRIGTRNLSRQSNLQRIKEGVAAKVELKRERQRSKTEPSQEDLEKGATSSLRQRETSSWESSLSPTSNGNVEITRNTPIELDEIFKRISDVESRLLSPIAFSVDVTVEMKDGIRRDEKVLVNAGNQYQPYKNPSFTVRTPGLYLISLVVYEGRANIRKRRDHCGSFAPQGTILNKNEYDGKVADIKIFELKKHEELTDHFSPSPSTYNWSLVYLGNS